MSIFPLLQMNDLPFELVFEAMGALEMFNLSFATPQMWQTIKTSIARMDPKPTLSLSLHSTCHVWIQGPLNQSWRILHARDIQAPDVEYENSETLNINGVEFKFGALLPFLPVVCVSDKPDFAAVALAEYLMDLFSCDLDYHELGSDNFYNLDAVFNSRALRRPCNRIFVNGSSLLAQEIEKFMDEFQANHLQIWSYIVDDFTYQKPITARSIYCSSAHWFTLQNLLDFGGVRVRMGNTSLRNEHFRQFIQHWLENGNKKMEVTAVESRQIIDQDLIMQGIDIEEIDPYSVRVPFERYPSPQGFSAREIYHRGTMIRRPSDGQVASIYVQHNNCFFFIAWESFDLLPTKDYPNE